MERSIVRRVIRKGRKEGPAGIPQDVWDSYEKKLKSGYPLHLTPEEARAHDLLWAFLRQSGPDDGGKPTLRSTGSTKGST